MIKWPYNKDFAFTIVDDTDHAALNTVKPIYELLEKLQFKTTKTVWVNHVNNCFASTSFGHDKQSMYFWGDLCKKHIKYVRGKCFNDINTLKIDPFMPYSEKRFPCVNAWFSCSDGATPVLANQILSKKNQERLAKEHGLCILYTHFGVSGFVDDNYEVNHEFKENVTALSQKNGWFAPASEILDFLSQKVIKHLTKYQEMQIVLNILRSNMENKIWQKLK
jgi:hypothetical protein